MSFFPKIFEGAWADIERMMHRHILNLHNEDIWEKKLNWTILCSYQIGIPSFLLCHSIFSFFFSRSSRSSWVIETEIAENKKIIVTFFLPKILILKAMQYSLSVSKKCLPIPMSTFAWRVVWNSPWIPLEAFPGC